MTDSIEFKEILKKRLSLFSSNSYWEEFVAASEALFRLQDTYNLTASQLSQGILQGKHTNAG